MNKELEVREMDLEQFVNEALVQIFRGVQSAQAEVRENDDYKGVINPKWGKANDYDKYASAVEFDIAISVSKQTSGEGKAGIRVAFVEVGGAQERSFQQGSVSRVSFKVPVVFSVTPVSDVPPSPVVPR